MKKVEVLRRLENARVIAVLRTDSKEGALEVSHAVVEGGMIGLKSTLIVPQADEVIRSLVETYHDEKDIVIGADTMLDAVTARLAIMAGVEFIVSPSFNRGTTEICNLYQAPYLPECMIITEVQTALKSGVNIVKLSPGSTYDPSIISTFQAPLPYLNIMSTGGVSLNSMASQFEAGVTAVGVGGNLLAHARTGEFGKVTALAKQYMAKFREIRENQSWQTY